jgi:hypothetical protein
MGTDVAERLMLEFAESTAICGPDPPRRYLWTDAFAVCNFLGLHRETGQDRHLELALRLVDQVHHVLGRHRSDDSRTGWISGLPDAKAELHPTIGGLRIGKKLNERAADEPADPRLEWDQDGQYFHYLTKWMHALHQVSQVTQQDCYLQWASELAVVAHQSFICRSAPGGPQRMVWKMSIDLRRPLVSSMGQHDPLDGLISCLELARHQRSGSPIEIDLQSAVIDFASMCAMANFATGDSLGIGGLLAASLRLAQITDARGVDRHRLLVRLLRDSELSLQIFGGASNLRQPAEQRLAFREFGLSIGLHAMEWMTGLVGDDSDLAAIVNRLVRFHGLADQIEQFWVQPGHRQSQSWLDHLDINDVMFASSLRPIGFLQI